MFRDYVDNVIKVYEKKIFSGKRIDTTQTGNSQNAKNKLINRKHQIKKA